MAFSNDYFTQMGYGGKGGNSIWHYYDWNGDNVASLTGAGGDTAYFHNAYKNHGILGRAGDIILISSFKTPPENVATPCIALIPNDWDSNGATVIIAHGKFN